MAKIPAGKPARLKALAGARTIENVWKVERRNQNAEAMAERAGRLFGKFVAFVEDLRGLGLRLQQAQVAYATAMGKLQTGSENLIGQAEKLKELGAKTAKHLPESVIAGAANGEAAEAAAIFLDRDEAPDELNQGLLTFDPPELSTKN
jgi:DNA recombination protein RmuC